MSDADFYLKGQILTLRKDMQRLQADHACLKKQMNKMADDYHEQRIEWLDANERVEAAAKALKANLDSVRFAVMLAGQSIVEAHGEDSAAYEAIQSVAKALEETGDD